MCPEAWKNVHSALLLYWGERELIAQISPAIKALHHALPDLQLTLITPDPNFQINLQNNSLRVVSFLDWGLNLSASNELHSSNLRIAHTTVKSFIQTLIQQSFDASIVFTNPTQSPYVLAYFCYLAGIPIRLGQSPEFGGGVLSTCVKPSTETDSIAHYHLHLLKEAGFSTENIAALAIA
jgi:ADP-heptose:LPS heptosyltransferase